MIVYTPVANRIGLKEIINGCYFFIHYLNFFLDRQARSL